MDTQNQPSEKNVKNITLGSVIAWIFSIFIGVPAIFMLFSQPVPGLLTLIAALIVFPPMSKVITDKFKLSLSRGLKIFIVIVLLVIAVSTSSSDKIPTPQEQGTQGTVAVKTEPTKEAIKVTAIKMSEEYKANEISADAKYKGNIVEVSGIVDNIAKDFLDTPYITLKTSEYSIVSIQCMFSKANESKLATVTKGQQITLRGEVSGKMGNVLVRGCQIIK